MSSISCKSNFLPKQWRKHLFMNQTWVLRYYRLYLTKKSKASRFWIKILLPGYSCGFPFCHSYSNNDGSRYPKSDFGYLVYSLIFSKPFLKIFLFRIVENRSIFVSFDQYSPQSYCSSHSIKCLARFPNNRKKLKKRWFRGNLPFYYIELPQKSKQNEPGIFCRGRSY